MGLIWRSSIWKGGEWVSIELCQISKTFGEKKVLNTFSLLLPEGQTCCIMGPSGAGKTTLLRILMGLETADSGELHGIEGRRLSAVFQEDRLCENLSLRANIHLVCPHLAKTQLAQALEAVGLAQAAAQPVRELSGGMRRRAALVRALLADWDFLLMDEPFQGLDAQLKQDVIAYTRRMISGKTVLMVTHDAQEATAIGARIVQFEECQK